MPTGVKAWEQLSPDSFVSWKANFQKIYKITKDNKLRQFLFKLLHRITVTKRELKRFKITVDDQCFLCFIHFWTVLLRPHFTTIL